MTKNIIKYSFYLFGSLSIIYTFFMLFLSSSFTSSSQNNWSEMQSAQFECPKGTEVTYRGWGKNGQMRYCEALKNGPWETWEDGYKNILGSYKDGKKHGKWTVYHKDGRIFRIIEYDNGTEVTNNIINE